MTEETPAYTADQAFNDAKAGFEVNGYPLAKYSMSRKAAADAMGLRYGYVPEDDPMLATGKYSGAFKDTIIVLWLCSIPNASEQTPEQIRNREWSVQRATRKPEEAYEASLLWAESIGIESNDGERFLNAYMHAFLPIMRGEAVSRFGVTTTSTTPSPPEDPESPNV